MEAIKQRMDIDIVIVSETKKKGNRTDSVLLCWNGVKKDDRAEAGVGVLIMWRRIRNLITEMIIKVKMKIYGRQVIITGVYGIKEDSLIAGNGEFMNVLKRKVEKIKQSQELIIAGYLNGTKRIKKAVTIYTYNNNEE